MNIITLILGFIIAIGFICLIFGAPIYIIRLYIKAVKNRVAEVRKRRAWFDQCVTEGYEYDYKAQRWSKTSSKPKINSEWEYNNHSQKWEPKDKSRILYDDADTDNWVYDKETKSFVPRNK